MSIREKLLALKGQRKTEKVFVSEIDCEVTVRGMTAAERDEWEQRIAPRRRKGDGNKPRIIKNWRASVLVETVLDDDGKPAFTLEDVATLGTISGDTVDRLYAVAARLCGIGPRDEEYFDELSKNSSPTQDAGSASA